MNEKELLELEYKSQQLQIQALEIVMKEYPEAKPLLKSVWLEICGVNEKEIRKHMGWDDESEPCAIDDASDDEEKPKSKKNKKKQKKKSK